MNLADLELRLVPAEFFQVGDELIDQGKIARPQRRARYSTNRAVESDMRPFVLKTSG